MRRRLFLVFILISTFAVAGCKISGTITTDDGVGVEGVTVVLKGEGEDGDALRNATAETDADGNYVFVGLYHGTVTITPESDAYTFDPPSIPVTVDFFENEEADFVATALSSPLPQPPPLEPWSTYQGDAAHTGYVPVSLNPENFNEAWIWPQDGMAPFPINPVAAGDGKVFVTSGDDDGPQVAVALDSANGTPLWTYEFGVIASVHPPAFANGTVYIQSGVNLNSFLRAFNAESGAVISEISYVNQSGRFYAPTIYDDVNVGVYTGGGYIDEFGGERGRAYGHIFDPLVPDPDLALEELWNVDFTSFQSDQWTPAVNEEHVIAYHGVFDGKLTVIHRLDGETWAAGEVDFIIPDPNFKNSGTSLNLAPVLGSQNNVIVIQGGRLISFDLANRIIGWEIQEGFSVQPSLAKGIIYAVNEGNLQARNEKSDGSFIWEWQPPDGESINAPMIVTDNLIFVSTAATTYAVDLAGQTLTLPQELSDLPGGQLALSDEGVLFIATAEGNLIAINTD